MWIRCMSSHWQNGVHAALTRRVADEIWTAIGIPAGSLLGVSICAGLLFRAVAVSASLGQSARPGRGEEPSLPAARTPNLFGPGRLPFQRCCRLQGGCVGQSCLPGAGAEQGKDDRPEQPGPGNEEEDGLVANAGVEGGDDERSDGIG